MEPAQYNVSDGRTWMLAGGYDVNTAFYRLISADLLDMGGHPASDGRFLIGCWNSAAAGYVEGIEQLAENVDLMLGRCRMADTNGTCVAVTRERTNSHSAICPEPSTLSIIRSCSGVPAAARNSQSRQSGVEHRAQREACDSHPADIESPNSSFRRAPSATTSWVRRQTRRSVRGSWASSVSGDPGLATLSRHH